jgi:hypothetical protein
MFALITLASIALGAVFRADGLTLKKMGLAGVTRKNLSKILHEGF